jgi:transcriptional regulator with XRE-family HTH domain
MTKRERDLSRLSAELARWRNEAGMTQQELAVAVGATLNYIQKVEGKGGKANKVRPSMDRLIMIVTTLDSARYQRGMSDKADRIDMNYALSLAGYPPIAVPIEWVSVLQRIAEIPTNTINTQEDVNRIAHEIAENLMQGQVQKGHEDTAMQHTGSIPGSDSTGDKGQTQEGGKGGERRPPPHGGR